MVKFVSYYKCGFPAILKPSPKISQDSSDSISFYTYIIRCTVLERGRQHPLLLKASEFLLLNPLQLDPEVAFIVAHLNLAMDAQIEAKFNRRGKLTLDPQQVELTKRFNSWLFSVVLGRNPNSLETACVLENTHKSYYVLPLKEVTNEDRSHPLNILVDWESVERAEKSGIPLCPSGFVGEPRDASIPCNYNMDRILHLHSGDYREEELIDSVITCLPQGVSYYVSSVLEDVNSYSFMDKGNISYADYWLKKFQFHVRNLSQPLLQAYKLPRACDNLRRPHLINGNSGNWCKKTVKKEALPAEACIVHTGLKGKLMRGASWLPSILYHLEKCLLCIELREKIGEFIPHYKVLEALTSGACDTHLSYEHLELLGDSYLTMVGALELYVKQPNMNKDDIGLALHDLVRNEELFHYAEACNLPYFAFARSFLFSEWIPPGPISSAQEMTFLSEKRDTYSKGYQKLSNKTLADIIEALVGSYLIAGRKEDSVWVAMKWMRIPINFVGTTPRLHINNAVDGKTLPFLCNIKELETKLDYKFKNPAIVCVAFNTTADDGVPFGRLEFLGSAIVSHIIVRHILELYPKLKVGDLDKMKQNLVNSEYLGFVVMKNGLDIFLQNVTAFVRDQIEEFRTAHQEESTVSEPMNSYGMRGRSTPKVLGETIRSLTAIIFFDSNLNLEAVKRVLLRLIEQFPTPNSICIHPFGELMSFCLENRISLSWKFSEINDYFRIQFTVGGVVIAATENKEEKVARRFGAEKALQWLRKRGQSMRVTPCIEQSIDNGTMCLARPQCP